VEDGGMDDVLKRSQDLKDLKDSDLNPGFFDRK
jgi:hypothetical protein